MSKRGVWPCALTVAGSDSGGGAGIQADLKTFAALQVHGTSVITCVTAQNPREVRAVEAISARMVEKQMEAVLDEFPVRALKLGMLYSREIIEAVGRKLESTRPRPVIIADPVMIASSGKNLLLPAAKKALEREILRRCDLMTPNVPEAEELSGLKIKTPEDLRAAARALLEKFGCAVLAKGGHLKNKQSAIDIFYDGKAELLLQAPFTGGVSTHGSGCTYSAAICGYCARGYGLESAVIRAKTMISEAIVNAVKVGKHDVLNPRKTHDELT